ncbi:RES family NAD+ phosphorylase [Bradyrhizobium sp. LHD-71]|uniref:RES family NAD+ phosphorylase n=1 Tax=Bradyrhizobium sp. LHD-71 TaxID=3072141 RepID=UPI00280FCA1F|nr:RES family NAD+ phosphorylase [Bradyrhizobium sp. LHD-71]MDQ8730512.1 RES family NAD+ phosphorylase [Bradyrhizobium sp. LHD-71]
MSSITWTRDALLSSAKRLAGACWRVVESQSRGITLKLTDTLEEQLVLERVIEATKPPVPEAARHLHYLLFTPFRYSPYPTASRFRRAGVSAGVFYASEHSETAIAETVFYRLLFFFESPGTPWPKNPFDFRAFEARFDAARASDLTEPPLDAHHRHWTDPVDYTFCLSFADTAREAGIQAIRYQSVRDPQARANLALLDVAALVPAQRFAEETWILHFSNAGVRAICESPRRSLAFDRTTFVADPRAKEWRWER